MTWPVVLALIICIWPAADVAVAGQVPDPPAQVDIPDLIRMLRKQPAPPPSTNQTPSHTQISYLPTISSNPAIGVGVGAVMSVAAQRAGADGRLSTAQASLTVTTKSQVIGALRNNILSRGEAWSLVGDVRLAKFYQRAPVLGSDTAADDRQVDVNYNWIRIYQTAYRRLGGSFHLGVGYHLDSFMDIRPAGTETVPAEAIAEVNTLASGLSANALFDSRDNPLNASRGLYGRASYHFYPESMGSDRDWQSLQVEGRAYRRLPTARRQVLAAWLQSWQTIEGSPPYFNLASVGWDTYGRSARGYTAGSLRGPDWTYLEGEYRVDLMRNGLLGAVGFVNASSLSDRTGEYGAWAVAGGAGLRVKLDKQYGTNIAMDFAWGRNGSKGVWFGLNEVF